MFSALTKKWTDVFSLLNSEERLSVLLVLFGSKFIRHQHFGMDDDTVNGCLSFTQIRNAAEITSDTRLSYHLSKLLDARLIEKIAYIDKKERVFPMYKTTEKWDSFARDFGFDAKIRNYIQERYPELFVSNEK